MGYTFFDTAEVYGTAQHPHDNEEPPASELGEILSDKTPAGHGAAAGHTR